MAKTESFYTSDGNYILPDKVSVTHGSRAMGSSSDINLKTGHNRYDTEYHRPEDKIPTTYQEMIQLCQGIYKKNGLVRNIIDLMADFASEGIDLRHPIKSQERFYKEWAKRVDLEARAHDFMKYLMRDANVVVRRKNALIGKPAVKKMSKADFYGSEPLDETKTPELLEKVDPDQKKGNKKEIPWSYVFLSPAMVEKIGGAVGKFFGSQQLAMRISTELQQSITNPKTDAEKEFVKKIPEAIRKAAKKGVRLIALDPELTYVEYYEKDDWEDWGTPFLMGIVEDILLKDKMKQADMAALDGVVNAVRLWKLGNSDKQIFPTPTAVNKLVNILQHNVGGGVMDLVWDDMIDFKIDYPPVDQILGSAKYESVNKDIIRGLGVPDALIGGSESANSNAQTAFVQLKTLVERLEYVRAKCIRWIENELQLVADAVGFAKIPKVTFETMSLRDETAEKQLMIQLLDRNIVSTETIHKVFGKDFEIELENMRLENTIRSKNPELLEKANPYYTPLSTMRFQKDTQMEMKKTEMGGDNPNGDQPKKQGQTPPGRPPNLKDTKVRKPRTPKVLAALKARAEEIVEEIDSIIDPIFLSKNDIKNIRSLSKQQKEELRNVKFLILSNINVGDSITLALIENIVANPNNSRINDFYNVLNELCLEYKTQHNKELSIGVIKSLSASCWAILVDN
jgi:hypothetical protein